MLHVRSESLPRHSGTSYTRTQLLPSLAREWFLGVGTLWHHLGQHLIHISGVWQSCYLKHHLYNYVVVVLIFVTANIGIKLRFGGWDNVINVSTVDHWLAEYNKVHLFDSNLASNWITRACQYPPVWKVGGADEDTNLAAPGALTHSLHFRTAFKIQMAAWGPHYEKRRWRRKKEKRLKEKFRKRK